MSEKCAKCDKIVSKDYIMCGGICGLKFHDKCAILSDTALNFLKSSINFSWKCNACASVPVLGLVCKVSELGKIVQQLLEDIKSLKNSVKINSAEEIKLAPPSKKKKAK